MKSKLHSWLEKKSGEEFDNLSDFFKTREIKVVKKFDLRSLSIGLSGIGVEGHAQLEIQKITFWSRMKKILKSLKHIKRKKYFVGIDTAAGKDRSVECHAKQNKDGTFEITKVVELTHNHNLNKQTHEH